MPIKFYNPTSPGRRAGSVLDYKAVLTKFKPEKSLTVGQRRANGRNHHGVITAKHHGGGNKRLYRLIDFKRNTRDGQPATVTAIEYDPNRSCFIALIQYPDGAKSYILAPNGLTVGATVLSGPDSPPEVGNCVPLVNIPGGLEIHNIEMNPGQGGKLVRSAGGVARLSAKEGEWVVIILPSGEMRRIKGKCRATIGQLGNLDHANVSIGKAGRSRHMGIRPHTRAKAMNPIDHPLGGGEGRSNGGRHPVSRTGVPAKGGITRRPRKNSEKLILRRRKFGEFQRRPQTVPRTSWHPSTVPDQNVRINETGRAGTRGFPALTSKAGHMPRTPPVVEAPSRNPTNGLTVEQTSIIIRRKTTRREMSDDDNQSALFGGSLPAALIGPKRNRRMTVGTILHLGLGAAIPGDLSEKMLHREISEIYLDVSRNSEGRFEPDDVITTASRLHRLATAPGVTLHPVVVGPLTRRDHAVARQLALKLIRVSPLTYDRYVEVAHSVGTQRPASGQGRTP